MVMSVRLGTSDCFGNGVRSVDSEKEESAKGSKVRERKFGNADFVIVTSDIVANVGSGEKASTMSSRKCRFLTL
jgi:hypothetical protein